MPFYQDLKRRPQLYGVEGPKFIAARLVELRKILNAQIPERDLRRSLIVGTWNIRDFDNNKFGQGPRRQEAFHYLAEVVSRFDICAIQEIDADLQPLKRLMQLLGSSYEYMVTDVTLGASGNGERLAFVYDTRKVTFRNLVGEIVLPPGKTAPSRQIARTPFMAAFQAGWFHFVICTGHIYYGEDSPKSAGFKRRVEEIATLSKLLAERAKAEGENYIFLGDFNVVSKTDATMKALLDGGFTVPAALFGPANPETSNLGGDKIYDQIAFRPKSDELKFMAAGVFDWRQAVFRDADFARYRDAMPVKDDAGAAVDPAKLERHFQTKWRTWQMSDHLPKWVQLEIDFSDAYLERIALPTP